MPTNFPNATGQAVSDFMGDNVSVRMYAGAPDGVTDCAPGIQKLIDDFPDGTRCCVRFPHYRAGGAVYRVNSPLNVGNRRLVFDMEACIIECAQTLFTTTPSLAHEDAGGGSVSIIGRGREATKIHYTGTTGVCIDYTGTRKADIQNVSILRTGSAGNATGLRFNQSQRCNARNLNINGFGTCLEVTGQGSADTLGSAYPLSNSIGISGVNIRDYTTVGIKADHVVELFLQEVQTFCGGPGNTGLWAMRLGTNAQGVYFKLVSLANGGLKIEYPAASTNQWEQPPNWIFADNLICDTGNGVAPLRFDESLMNTGIFGLIARGFFFTNSWFCGADLENAAGPVFAGAQPNVYIGGGYDISMTECRARGGRGHGIYVKQLGSDLRLVNVECTGNDLANGAVTNSAGLYIDSTVGGRPVQVIGGVYSAELPSGGGNAVDDGSQQKYGIYSAAPLCGLTVVGANMEGNKTGPYVFAGTRQHISGCRVGAPTVTGLAVNITGATNASPIVIQAAGHGLATNDFARVANVGGNTAANGDWHVTRIDADNVRLTWAALLSIPSAGNGAYTSGGTIQKLVVPQGIQRYQQDVMRSEFGDDLLFLQKGSEAGIVTLGMGSGAQLNYDRVEQRFKWIMGGNRLIDLAKSATSDMGEIQVFPQTGAAAAQAMLTSVVPGEANVRFTVAGSGRMLWGPGGASATDLELYRAAAQVAALTGALYASQGINLSSAALPTAQIELAAQTSSVPPIKLTGGTLLASLTNGTIEYDGTHIYATVGGVRYALTDMYDRSQVYTKSEVDALLAGKSNTGHTHTFTGAALGTHTHTETGTVTGATSAGTPSGTIS